MQDRTGYPDKCPCLLSLGNLMVIMQRISFPLADRLYSEKSWYLCWSECWRIPKITLHMLYYLIMSCEFSLENSHWYLLFCVLRTCLPCFTLTLWTCTSALCHKVHQYFLFRTLFWTYPFLPTYRLSAQKPPWVPPQTVGSTCII